MTCQTRRKEPVLKFYADPNGGLHFHREVCKFVTEGYVEVGDVEILRRRLMPHSCLKELLSEENLAHIERFGLDRRGLTAERKFVLRKLRETA